MTLIQTILWKIINKTNNYNKTEIDYLISETKNFREKRKLKKIKKLFTMTEHQMSCLNDDVIIKLIDSKLFLKFLLISICHQ